MANHHEDEAMTDRQALQLATAACEFVADEFRDVGDWLRAAVVLRKWLDADRPPVGRYIPYSKQKNARR